MVPLVPYLLPIASAWQSPAAAGLTLLTFFAVGAGRGALSPPSPWRAGLEMLLVGALAAAVAYGAGTLNSPIAGDGMSGVNGL